jgi:hypothetical protein
MTSPQLQQQARKVSKDTLVVFCRSLPGATEDVKWGKDLIFSVGGKMFAGFLLAGGDPIGFKVDPLVFASLVAQGCRPGTVYGQTFVGERHRSEQAPTWKAEGFAR